MQVGVGGRGGLGEDVRGDGRGAGDGFDSANVFPLDVTFWRRSAATRVLHRNPIFSAEVGTSVDILCADTSIACIWDPLKIGVVRCFGLWSTGMFSTSLGPLNIDCK